MAALSKRQAHKEIQNHKFETRNSKRGKFQGSSLQFQEKTEDFETEEARSEAASSKEQRVRQECRTSLARSASSSAIHDPPRLSHSCSFAFIRGLNISARVGATWPHRPTGKRDKTSRSKIQEKISLLIAFQKLEQETPMTAWNRMSSYNEEAVPTISPIKPITNNQSLFHLATLAVNLF